ncbi:MAG: chemotaxis protein CheW [Myxacorys californica WJT36-NPBG1]|nr:chemotaxis protein CheW [Myxacorys californica WJT36-NPBG1]
MVNPSALSLTPARTRTHQGEPYLKFQVTEGVQAGLIMKQVQEVLVLPTPQLTPIPNLPVGVLGLMHRRSRVLWVVDLALLLGVGVLDYSPQQYDIVIVRTGGAAIALAIRQVGGIAGVQPTHVQPLPSHAAKGLIPYSRGCILQPQEIVFLLDGEAILQAPILQGNGY